MSSLCHNIKTSYERLQTLTAGFTQEYKEAKASGDLTAVKQFKKELEAARDALRKELLVFVVSDARNPYREALLEAGLTDTDALTAERQEMIINIPEEIKRQTALYTECKDKDGKPTLTEWVTDITNRQDLLFAEVARDYDNIQERIKAGMIPTIMPSRSVQERTWKEALINLKPIWVKENEGLQAVDDSYLYDLFEMEKMNADNFFKDIPDRPYIIWTQPSQKPDSETCTKTFDEQKIHYAHMVEDHPKLYQAKDIIPTEYIALLSNASHAVHEGYRKSKGKDAEPAILKPLDHDTYTRFLSTGAFSGGAVPCAGFNPGYRQVSFGDGIVVANGRGGFRPAARS